jgi:internalin A
MEVEMADAPAPPAPPPPADDASSRAGSLSFLSGLKASVEASKLYLTLLGLLAGVPGAILVVAAHWGVPLWLAGIACVVPALLILLWLVPAFIDQQDRRRAIAFGIHGQVKDPEYFRLTPYDAASDFRRADKAHEKVYAWLVGNPAPLLYLSGASGSGKSSIICGWVLPKLTQEGVPMHVVSARVVGDPITVLTQALLKPGAIWERPPSEGKLSLRELLERSAKRVAAEKLLLVLDQFEEFLILADDKHRTAFTALLRTLAELPVPNLQVLMILRSDYEPLLDELELQAFEQDRKTVPPFFERDAMAFLRASELQISDTLEAEILEEAREVEQTPGLIRPITVNLFGLVLRRFDNLPTNYRKGTLLRSFLRELIQRKEIRDFASPILRSMMTANGTKQPLACTDVARAVGLDPRQVRGCLVQLANEGVVRELDRGKGIWEIAHDFIAGLYHQILSGWRASVWRRARPWVIGVGFGLWLIGLLVAWSPLREYPHERALADLGFSWGACDKTLASGSAINPWTSCVALTAKPALDDSKFAEALPHLRALHRPLALNLPDAQIRSENLGALNGLDVVQLDLTGAGIRSLDILKEMRSLKVLVLHRCPDLENIDAAQGLTSLESLNLWQTRVRDLRALEGLTALRELDLRYTQVSNLDPLKGLVNLETLKAGHNRRVQNINPLGELTNLKFLDLNETQVGNLDALRKLHRLRELYLGQTPVTDIDIVRGMPSLITLTLDESRIKQIDAVQELRQLRILRLDSTTIENIDALKGLTALDALSLADTGVQDIYALKDLKALHYLWLDNTGVRDINALKDLTALHYLWLDNTGVRDINALKDLTELRVLSLSNTGVQDIEVLKGLTALKWLDLRRTEIHDAAPLKGLTNLTGLGLPRTNVQNVDTVRAALPRTSLFFADKS